jgi:hypothetical protein
MNVYGSTISAMNVGGFYQAGLGLDFPLAKPKRPESLGIIIYIYKSHTSMGYRVATYQPEFQNFMGWNSRGMF